MTMVIIVLLLLLTLLIPQSILSQSSQSSSPSPLSTTSSTCSLTSYLLKTIDNVTDSAWEMYVKDVYGSSAYIKNFDFDYFQSVYNMADVNVISDWRQNPIKEYYMQHFIRKKAGPGLFDWSHGYPSNSWVEVTRSRECTHIYFSFQEGLSTGAKYEKADFSYNDTIPYGCW